MPAKRLLVRDDRRLASRRGTNPQRIGRGSLAAKLSIMPLPTTIRLVGANAITDGETNGEEERCNQKKLSHAAAFHRLTPTEGMGPAAGDTLQAGTEGLSDPTDVQRINPANRTKVPAYANSMNVGWMT